MSAHNARLTLFTDRILNLKSKLQLALVSPLFWGMSAILLFFMNIQKNGDYLQNTINSIPLSIILYLAIGLSCFVIALLPGKVIARLKTKVAIVSFALCFLLIYAFTTLIELNSLPSYLVLACMILEGICFSVLFCECGSRLSNLYPEDAFLLPVLAFGVAAVLSFIMLILPAMLTSFFKLTIAFLVIAFLICRLPADTRSLVSPNKLEFPQKSKADIFQFIAVLFIFLTVIAYWRTAHESLMPSAEAFNSALYTAFLGQISAFVLMLYLSMRDRGTSLFIFFRILFLIGYLTVLSSILGNKDFGPSFFLLEIAYSCCYILQWTICFSISRFYSFDTTKLFALSAAGMSIALSSPYFTSSIMKIGDTFRLGELPTIAIVLTILFVTYMFSFNTKALTRRYQNNGKSIDPSDSLKKQCERAAAHYGLSKREKELLPYFCEGKTNKEISAEIYISEGTIRVHKFHVYNKLNVHNVVELEKLIEGL